MVYLFRTTQAVGITQTAIHNQHTGRIAQKEKSHVVDYHRNSSNTLAAGFFRPERLFWLTANWQRRSRLARHRGRPRCCETVGDRVDL
jgi:hypothetical protein